MCLPVLADDDVNFQFIVQAATEQEADDLCQIGESGIRIGLVRDCDQPDFDIEFLELPDRFRISPTQLLYNWSHGFPGMTAEFAVSECFFVRVIVPEAYPPYAGCSNCFQRIDASCFSSVIEYGNDENFAGFNYCGSGGDETDISGLCEPTIITFLNQETLTIPYTAAMQVMYGQVPTVQVWLYDMGGNLVNAGIQVQFDAMPPTLITADFGGMASGVMVIK